MNVGDQVQLTTSLYFHVTGRTFSAGTRGKVLAFRHSDQRALVKFCGSSCPKQVELRDIAKLS